MFKQKCKWCGEWMYFQRWGDRRAFCSKRCSVLHKEHEYNEEGTGPVMPPLDASKITDEGYIALVKAVVSRASTDVTHYKPGTQIHMAAVKFFESEDFSNLTGLDGKAILRDLLKKHEKRKPETRGKKQGRSQKCRVRCIETGAVYDSIKQAAHVCACQASSIQNVCAGKRHVAGGLHWEYVKEEET